MGRRGPKPKPDALKVINGGFGKKQKQQLKKKTLETAPDYLGLNVEAKKIWSRKAPAMIRMGILTNLDIEIFGVYCSACAAFYAADKFIAGSNALIQNGSQIVPNPMNAVRNKNYLMMINIGSRFGFSPSDRVGLNLETLDEDPLDILIAKYKK